MDDSKAWPLAFDLFDSRPTLVLLHAFPLDRRMWHPQADALAECARVMVPDLPGFGESDAAPPSLDAWADEIDELLDDLAGGEPVVVAGLSMGGYVALRLAARHPERLEALILAYTRAGADSEEGRAARDQAIFKVRRHGVATLAEDLLGKLFSPQAPPDAVAFAREIILEQSPEAVAAALAAMRDRPDSGPVLPGIDVPTLVIVGADDVLTPPPEAEAMARAIPNSWLVRIPRAGHLANLEAPEQVTAAIRGFLGAL